MKKKMFNLQTFCNTCIIAKPFELARGNFMDFTTHLKEDR